MQHSPVDEPYATVMSELPAARSPNHRYRCSRTNDVAGLGRVNCSNGLVQYKAYCMECGGKGGNFLHSEIEGLDLDRIPVLRQHMVDACERCGSDTGTEVHHWAPAHLFDDYFDWPTSKLCKSCHALWHRVVTPNMSAIRRNAA